MDRAISTLMPDHDRCKRTRAWAAKSATMSLDPSATTAFVIAET
jgi:hypothetical protein